MSLDASVTDSRDRELAVDVTTLDLSNAGRLAADTFDVRLVPMPIAAPERRERVRAAAAIALGTIGLIAFGMAAAAIALG